MTRAAPVLILACSILCVAAGAQANSIGLVVTSTSGPVDQVVGNTVYRSGPGAVTVTYDLILDNTSVEIENFVAYAEFSNLDGTPQGVDAASGTTEAFVFFGGGFISPVGTQWADFQGDSLEQLALSAAPAGDPLGIAPGCNCLIGTLTVTTSASSTRVTVTGQDPLDIGLPFPLIYEGEALITVIPEPGTARLVDLGLLGIALSRREDV